MRLWRTIFGTGSFRYNAMAPPEPFCSIQPRLASLVPCDAKCKRRGERHARFRDYGFCCVRT
jgi:hypothetical protein